MADQILTTLRLLGQRAYVTGARASSTAIRDIGHASDQTSAGQSLLQGSLSATSGAMNVVASAGKSLALVLGALVGYGAKVGLEFNASMEQAEIGMTTLLKSGEEAKATVEAVRDFALKAPLFGVSEMVQSAQTLIGAGYDAKKIVPTLTTFSDTLAAMGRNPEDLMRMRYAFVQMMSKGQISAEELRGQLGEIFPASKLLARGMGISMKELSDQMKTGSLKGRKYIDILLKEMDKEFGGATERSAKTWNGMIANIKESGKYTLGLVTKPLFDALKDNVLPKIQEVQEGIQNWAKAGGVQKATTALKRGFGGMEMEQGGGIASIMETIGQVAGKVWPMVTKFVGDFIDAIEPARPFFENVLLPLFQGFLGGAASGFMALIPVIKIFARALGWIGKMAEPFKPLFKAIGFAIGFVFGPAKLQLFRPFGLAFRVIGGAIGKVFGWLTRISPIVNRVAGFFLSLGIRIAGLFGRLGSIAWSGISKVASAIGRGTTAVGGKVADLVGAAISAGTALLSKFWEFGKNIVSKIIEGLKATPGIVFNAILDILPKRLRGMASRFMGGIEEGQHGLTMRRPGMALVGEAGPELLALPRGAQVIPQAAPSLAPSLPSMDIRLVAPVFLKGREIGRAVADDASDKMARR